MNNDELLQRLIVDHLGKKLKRDYREITVNPGSMPDLRLANHGLVVAAVQVETAQTITRERARGWASLAGEGTKLMLIVPKNMKVKTTELLWEAGLAGKVSLGTYELVVQMP